MNIFVILFAFVAIVAGQGVFDRGGRRGGIAGGLGTSIANLPLPGTIANFADFVSKTGKRYATQGERTYRERILAEHQRLVDQNNALFQYGQSNFELGLNFLSDLDSEEFMKGLTGCKKSAQGDQKAKKHKNKASPLAAFAIPDSFDWREQGGVTPVKFQGLECGACWSFAVTGAIEGHIFRKTGQLINLSEQNLVDCGNDYGNTGCDGGFQEYGFEYVTENKGISKAEPYPFVEKQETCKYKKFNRGTQIKGYATIPPGNEALMKEVIATLGPIAASINAGPDSFQLYKCGIYDDMECNAGEVNHSVLIVGYGTENGRDYWIIKNSWTDKWGENGFMKIPRNENNYCGIASECSYPIV